MKIIKQLNKISKTMDVISTGYRTYVYYDEIWTDGFYNGEKTGLIVSSLGRVYDPKKKKYLKLFLNGSGYLYCQSYHKYKTKRCTILINRFVLESFKGKSKIFHDEADHINRIKTDNRLENLQWLSQIDNLHKRTYNQKGENNNYSKYTKKDILLIADMLQSGQYTCADISKKLNIPRSSINNIKLKIRWVELLAGYDFSVVPSKNKK